MWLAKYLLPLGQRKIDRGRIGLLGAAVGAGGAPPERAFRSQGLRRPEAVRPGRPTPSGARLPSGSGPGRLAVGRPDSINGLLSDTRVTWAGGAGDDACYVCLPTARPSHRREAPGDRQSISTRFAFDLARTRARRKVSSVTKSNAQQYGMVLWDDVFKRVAADYPDIETESVLVDAMSAKFVLRPEDLSVVVASNLNADILADLGSALAGSLGLAASANFNPERRFPSMFEPVHGSAPDIAGQGLANPVGAVGSAALMLEHFGLPDQAARLNKAIEATTAAGILTRDLGGTAATEDVTKALIDALDA
ncbi:isocitrate/isopropylmalate family dehydrogenase [Streptomyces paradoxus]|uniref:isocitrate/isopropylmalate family dehydrogenase n=1 Tax=Streptomyces paradoxus TaxID=66375 RepID=UPI00362DB684